MAYNRPGSFNPDALPAFAEPERNYPDKPAQKPQTAAIPHRTSISQPQQDPRYASKPPPAIPNQNSNNHLRSDSYGGSGSVPGRGPSPMQPMQPPGNYGYSTSPQANYDPRFPPNRPNPRPPLSPAIHGSADPTLLPLFRAVDKNNMGQLSEKELGAALVNGDWTAFDPVTIHLMIRMFDTDRSGTIGFDEFCGLWSFLASWRTLFDRFDSDRSGNISLEEYTNALAAFGYRLSPGFISFLFSTFDKAHARALSFDLFVQSCISLKRMTDSFKKYDDDRDGFITLSFEDFLSEILKQR